MDAPSPADTFAPWYPDRVQPGYRFEQSLRRDLSAAGIFAPHDDVVVGVSGGPDSMALLTALRALGRRHDLPLRLHVAHLDHRLRGAQSDRDAAFVTAHAREHGLPVFVEEAGGLGRSGANLEERAREARAGFLARIAARVGARWIALGHTRDDQAETVLQRLARGGGVRSLAAMEMRRDDGVVRPLLRRRRSECRRYLADMGVGSVCDESNSDPRFLRNRIRADVLPRLAAGLDVDVAERLAALADDLRVEAALADRWIAHVLGAERGGALPVAAVIAARGAAGRLVHAWLVARGLRPSRPQVDAVIGLAGRGTPSAGVDVSGGRVERRYERLECFPGRREDPPAYGMTVAWVAPGEVELRSGWRLLAEPLGPPAPPATDRCQALVDAARVEGALAVRVPRPGDRIGLRGGRRKLSDVFIDARVPRAERARLAVVTRGADILWVPGVAIAANAVPGPGTQRWMRLRAERLDCCQTTGMVENEELWVRFG